MLNYIYKKKTTLIRIILGVFAVIILISSTFDLISHQWSYCTGIPKTGPTQSIEIAHGEGDPQLVNEMTNVSKRKKCE